MTMKAKNKWRTHSENREMLCLLCLKKKNSMRKIFGSVEKKINKYFDYNSKDLRIPNVICVKCKIIIYRNAKEEKNSCELKLPDFSSWSFPNLNLQSDFEVCECTLCKKARDVSGFNFSKENRVIKKEKEEKKERKCSKCLSIIHKGKNHTCDSSNNFVNVRNHINLSFTSKEKEQLVSRLLKDVSSSSENTKLLSQKHGKPLRVEINSKEANRDLKRQISTEDMSKLAIDLSLSTRGVRKLSSALRVATKDRKLFEPGLREELKNQNHILDNFFYVKQATFLSFKKGIKKESNENLVYCNDLNELIKFVKISRNLQSKIYIKFGIDGGGGFLKVCLSILSEETNDKIIESKKSNRQTYSEGVAAKKFKDSGVKKLFLIGVAESVQENYDNVGMLWSLMNIRQFQEATISTDLKLANILTGLMAHSSVYPCTWCTADKDNLHLCGEYRTVGSCIGNFERWNEAGSKKNSAKLFKNCVGPPICSEDEDKEIIEIITPPELHLLIGIVNHIYKQMFLVYETTCLEWIKKCNVSTDTFNGSDAFAGNSCSILLGKVDILRAIGPIGCVKFAKCFEDLRKVVSSCFSVHLDKENFQQYIKDFEKSYCDLKISVTPKVHALIHHVPYFCLKTGKGLGFYSEQAMEAVHADFKKIWEKYKLKKDHPNYHEHLLKAVCEYNSQHI